jgi:hypothetical protein
MEILKKWWLGVLAFIGILFTLFFREKGKRQDAEEKLVKAEYEKDKAVLDAEREALKDNLEVEKAKELSKEEMEDFLRGK